MIDYDKLKEAFNLANKLTNITGYRVDINLILLPDEGYGFGLHSFYDELTEDCLFQTKQELIHSQIDYWTSLLPDCDHESDTYSYIIQHSPRIYAKKCTKCHHFYETDSINYLDKIGSEILIDKCRHQSDGDVYTKIVQLCRCKKCGEYYR